MTQPTRHTCQDRTTADGSDWQCPRCSTLPAEISSTDQVRTLTESEHNRAWHAIEGAAGEEGADPGTVLNAVLRALGINPPAEETHVVAHDSNDPEHDTLPAWLRQRFDPRGPDWEQLNDDDRTYWEHQARAVRRAVTRGGFKTDPAARP